MGKTVVIDGKRQLIKYEEYFDQGITFLFIKEGVNVIGKYAFAENYLTNLVIPKSVRRISFAAFNNNPITEVTFYNNLPFISEYNFREVLSIKVIDGDWEFLESLLSRKNIEGKENFAKLEEIIIINDNLKYSEKRYMQKMGYEAGIEISFGHKRYLGKQSPKPIIELNPDNEVNKLLEEINLLSKGLDEQSNNIIQMKVTKLLNEYNKNLVNLKPAYYQEEHILTLECTNPRDLRNNLIISLNNLILLLNSRKKILNLSTKIIQYNEFVLNDKDIEVNEDNNFNKVFEIKEVSKIFENNFLTYKVRNLLLNIKMQINNNLDNLFNDKLDLTNLDIPSFFDSELDKIYQQALFLIPYENLLKSLELKGDSKLTTDLNNLNVVFSKVNSELLNSLFNKYQELVKKYIAIIKNNVTDIFNNQEFLSSNQIETDFRQELNLILEELNKELPKILENQKLLNDICLANDYMEYDCNEKNNWLISIIKEILSLTNNNLLEDNIKKNITSKIKNILFYWNRLLSNTDLSSLVKSLNNNYDLTSGVLIVKTKIISDFYEIKRKLESYLTRLEEYDKYNNLEIDKAKETRSNLMGKTVEIGYYSKIIDFQEYFKQGITHLVINDGVEEVLEYAFAKNSLTRLKIPKSVKKIEYAAFDDNQITELIICKDFPFINKYNFHEILKITVEDGDYDFLEEFLSRKKIKGRANFAKLKEINIASNRLKFSEKKRMQKLAQKHGIELNFISYLFFNRVYNTFIQGTELDNKLINMLKKIDMLCETLDGQSSYLIIEKVFKLLNDYKTNFVNLKPDYYQEGNVLTLECTSPKDLWNNLIVSLNNLILLLKSHKKILTLSTKMLQYYELIIYDTDLELEEDNNFNKLLKIKEISKIFENDFLIDRFKNLLLNTKMQINNNMDNVLNDKLDLTNLDIPSYFDSELDKIYQQALFLIPYENLLKSLRLKGDSKLAADLNALNDVFSKVNSELLNSLFNKYQELIKKYIDTIKSNVTDIFNNQEFLSANQIETNFRQELNLLLEELNKELPKILENQELLSDICLANKYIEYHYSENENWLISIIKEILILTNNNLLENNIVGDINDKLKKLLQYWYTLLSNNSLNSIVETLNNSYGLTSDVLIVKTKIISDFYEIKREVESYLIRLEKYSKYSSLEINKSKEAKSSLIGNNSKELKREYKPISVWDIHKS